MKRLLFGAMFLGLVIVVPIPLLAGAAIAGTLPPSIVFAAPPEVIVIPQTYVYVVPEIAEDIFFYNGWWWRPWQGRWYRSRAYSSGWVYYRSVPSFYSRIPSGWRTDYREHRWGGHQWNHQRIPYQQLQHNWRGWQKSRHWEKQQTWGVEGLKTRPQSGEVHRSRKVQPQSRETVKPRQSREVKPQSHGTLKSRQPQEGRPQPHETVKPRQSREAKPESHEGKPQFREDKPHERPE
jgi:hypothetical protein